MLHLIVMLARALIPVITLALAGCASEKPAAQGSAAPTSTATEAPCSTGGSSLNVDYAGEQVGSPTPRKAVEAWLAEEKAVIISSAVQELPQGLRYLDADGRVVAEVSASRGAAGTWLMSHASLCPDYFKRK